MLFKYLYTYMYIYLFYIIIYLYNIAVNQNVKERALFLQTFFFVNLLFIWTPTKCAK